MDGNVKAWSEPLRPIKGVMFDLDGTLLLSDRALKGYTILPGAADTLEALKKNRTPFVVLTNGSAYPAAVQAPKLRAIGLPVDDHQMLTPSSVTADYFVKQGVKSALILGLPGVGHALKEAGIDIRFAGDKGAEDVQAVYVGWHPDCTMKDIEAACKAIWNGAKLYIASDVPFFATREGRSIGYSYAIVGAIRRLTRAPGIILGKPSLHALRYVAKQLGAPMKDVAVVGDDPVVEMIMARKGGAMGFGVTTGVTSAEDWAAQPLKRRPHRVLKSVHDLLKVGALA